MKKVLFAIFVYSFMNVDWIVPLNSASKLVLQKLSEEIWRIFNTARMLTNLKLKCMSTYERDTNSNINHENVINKMSSCLTTTNLNPTIVLLWKIMLPFWNFIKIRKMKELEETLYMVRILRKSLHHTYHFSAHF